MNNKMPRTPFSTPLSGSARETEIRLRHIFSGPKKRPPALFLALVFAACLLCGNLVSCNVAEAEQPRPDIAVDWENLPELAPIYIQGENCDVLIEGLEGAYVEWNRDNSPSGGFLYFAHDPGFCCPSLAGGAAEGSALWKDRENRVISVTISVNDDRLEDGAIDGCYLHFVVDLGKEAVTESAFEAELGEALELSEEEMLYAGRVLARLMEEASVAVDPDASPRDGQEWTPVELDAGMLQNNAHRLDGPYDRPLTEGEAALLENLPADQLPREAVEVFQARRRDYWRDTLLPVAFDEGTDLTVYFVVNPDSMPDVEPSDSPLLWGDLERRGIVLRCGGQTRYFPLCWEGNAQYASNPLLLADDLDGDGRPEAALALCFGGGTGAYEENLYIFDLDTMTCTVPDSWQVPLEITASPNGDIARLVSGEKEWEVNISGLSDRFTGQVAVGNVVRFLRENGRVLCELDIDFTCDTLGYLASGRFPIVYEDGVYKLGPAERLGDVL